MGLGELWKDWMGGKSGTKAREDNDKLYDYREKVAEAENRILRDSGNITQEEYEANLDSVIDELEKSRDDSNSDIEKMRTVSAGINTVAAGLSTASAFGKSASAASNVVSKGTTEIVATGGENILRSSLTNVTDDVFRNGLKNSSDEMLKEIFKNSSDEAVKSAIRNGGGDLLRNTIKNSSDDFIRTAVEGSSDDILRKVLENSGDDAAKQILKQSSVEAIKKGVNTTVANAGKNSSKVMKVLTAPTRLTAKVGEKVGSGIGGVIGKGAEKSIAKTAGASLGRIAGAYAPAVGVRMWTDHKWKEYDDKLVTQIGELCAMCDYYDTQDEDMLSSQDTEYSKLAKSYADSTNEIQALYDSGQITKAEYEAKVKEVTESNYEQLTELNGKYADYGKYVVTEGKKATAANYDISNDVSYDDADPYYKKIYDDDPELKEHVEEAQKLKYGKCSNEFTAFFASINATIVKYCPMVATLEAAVLKAADSSFDFIRDKINGTDTVSRFQGHDISKIADDIKDFSEEHLEMRENYKEIAEEYKLSAAVSASEYIHSDASSKEDESTNDGQDNSEQPSENAGYDAAYQM